MIHRSVVFLSDFVDLEAQGCRFISFLLPFFLCFFPSYPFYTCRFHYSLTPIKLPTREKNRSYDDPSAHQHNNTHTPARLTSPQSVQHTNISNSTPHHRIPSKSIHHDPHSESSAFRRILKIESRQYRFLPALLGREIEGLIVDFFEKK